ncbi:hypothetical protein [Burkholderia vietnamiensis]|uniref:hypothetical protein n=1 Tax=Burkholderia vietnamiensis TaxID=60552 RepID=UPI0007532D93|nr:hypothetical protein [Burkholderia vietnamiensis]KVR93964.1 hypothetical protein WK27_29970 [Burkholderia vietnamiensis]UEC01203.1 hypothetical protein LK462_21820 [Burkholderia vietnamiensis]
MKRYPCIGSESKAQTKLCSCCENGSIKRIDIQTDWMRGNDDVMQVCDSHLAMARAGNWRELYRDNESTQARRRSAHEIATLVPRVRCPTFNRRVKEAGLADHMRDSHGVLKQ